jgi:hypothetical protein
LSGRIQADRNPTKADRIKAGRTLHYQTGYMQTGSYNSKQDTGVQNLKQQAGHKQAGSQVSRQKGPYNTQQDTSDRTLH